MSGTLLQEGVKALEGRVKEIKRHLEKENAAAAQVRQPQLRLLKLLLDTLKDCAELHTRSSYCCADECSPARK